MAATAAVAAFAAAAGGANVQRSASPELAQLNAVRRQLGLMQLVSDPFASQVAARMARRDRYDRPPQTLDAQPSCAVCRTFLERGRRVDPRALYRSLGGTRPVGFGLWRAGWTARDNLSVFFGASALVLDPRARTFDVARTPFGMLVVVVTVDPGADFRRAVRWPRGLVDPRRQLWTEVVLPPGDGFPHLYDTRAGQAVTVAYPLAMAKGLARSRLVAFGLNTTLAYGKAYRVGTGTRVIGLRTRSTPADFLRRSWRFRSLPDGDRKAFLAIVRNTPPDLERLLAEVDGAVTIVGSARGCHIADACEEVVGDHATIGFTHVRYPFVVFHELGHVVFDLALDERGRRIFLAAFKRAGSWETCCFRATELFADQLAFWALGGVPSDVDSYSDRMYLSPSEFARLLRGNAAYRPLPVRGLLER